MIVFNKLWLTLKSRGISQYKLVNDYKFSAGQLSRLRKNENINTHTINQLCELLDCQIDDICEYVKE